MPVNDRLEMARMVNLIGEVAPPMTSGDWLTAGIGVAIAAIIATASGIFRRRSVAVPNRLAVGASSFPVWMAILGAIAGSIFVPAMLIPPLLGPLAKPPTPHQSAIFSTISVAGGIVGLLLLHLLQEPRWRMSRPPLRAVVPAILGALAIIPLVTAVSILTQGVWHLLRLTAPQSHEVLLQLNADHDRLDRTLFIFSAVVLAPLFEEMFFRGLLQTAIRQITRRPWLAVSIASVLFAAAHASAWMFAPLLVLGLSLGYLYERTANLYVTIFIHASFNAIMIGVDLLTLSHR